MFNSGWVNGCQNSSQTVVKNFYSIGIVFFRKHYNTPIPLSLLTRRMYLTYKVYTYIYFEDGSENRIEINKSLH